MYIYLYASNEIYTGDPTSIETNVSYEVRKYNPTGMV